MHTQVSEQLFGRLGDFEKQLLQYVTKNRATIVAVVFLIFFFSICSYFDMRNIMFSNEKCNVVLSFKQQNKI